MELVADQPDTACAAEEHSLPRAALGGFITVGDPAAAFQPYPDSHFALRDEGGVLVLKGIPTSSAEIEVASFLAEGECEREFEDVEFTVTGHDGVEHQARGTVTLYEFNLQTGQISLAAVGTTTEADAQAVEVEVDYRFRVIRDASATP